LLFVGRAGAGEVLQLQLEFPAEQGELELNLEAVAVVVGLALLLATAGPEEMVRMVFAELYFTNKEN
jgi:hypothetical protein